MIKTHSITVGLYTKHLLRIGIICSALFVCSCTDPAPAAHAEKAMPALFAVLCGTWKNTDTKQLEKWTQVNDSSFRSVVLSISGTDTIPAEEAIIYPEQGKWIFENKVSNQNDGKAVKFISTLLTDTDIEFSNPAHDFPTEIHYRITGPASMKAFIIGPGKKGGKDTIYFNYARLKE